MIKLIASDLDGTIIDNKHFIPEDNFTTQVASVYRVVPFHNALDSGQMYHMIREEI